MRWILEPILDQLLALLVHRLAGQA